jgi:hypothetical protein
MKDGDQEPVNRRVISRFSRSESQSRR